MFIIYHTRAYARKLARDLRVTSYFPNQNVLSLRKQNMSVIVNWGCTHLQLPPKTPVGEKRILNADVSVCTSKIATFDRLRAASLAIPCIVLDPAEIVDGLPFYLRGKYLGRTDRLTGGRGITIYEKGTLPATGVRHDFFSQVVSKAYEVRLHVAGTTVICEQFKFIPEGTGTLIRNYDNGARFSAIPLEARIDPLLAQAARTLAIQSLAACALDFGALDMALSRRGNWVVFEINSAPGLSVREDTDDHAMPCTYDAYKTYFQSFLV